MQIPQEKTFKETSSHQIPEESDYSIISLCSVIKVHMNVWQKINWEDFSKSINPKTRWVKHPLIFYCIYRLPKPLKMEERGDLRGYGKGIYPSLPKVPTIPYSVHLQTSQHFTDLSPLTVNVCKKSVCKYFH